MKHADANLFMVRQGVTHRKIFATVIRDMENRDIPNLAILMNDIKLDQASYGYGYGYYSDDEETMRKKTWRERLFGKKKKHKKK